MKNKTLQRVLAFCLALCFCFTLGVAQPMEAHAAVAAPWVIYALITYMAAMGITFTVAGGVDAMVQAVQEKVDEYEVVYPSAGLIQAVLNGTNIQPPSQPPSGWNKNKGYFFLTAAAAQAVTSFIIWLVSDGGWSVGETVESSFTGSFAISDLYKNGDLVADNLSVDLTVLGDHIGNGFYNVDKMGSVFTLDDINVSFNSDSTGFANGLIQQDSSAIFWSQFVNTNNSNKMPSVSYYKNYSYWNSVSTNKFSSNWVAQGKNVDDIWGVTYLLYAGNSLFLGLVMDDGTVYQVVNLISTVVVKEEQSITVAVPTEIPQLSPSETEGVLLDTGTTAAETLEELGELFETVFTDTGTIPQPSPRVVTDPSYTVEPSPVVPEPDTPTYTDVETLGLPALGDALMSKFPFCLVTDISRVVNIFTTTRETPKWEVDILAPLADRIPFQGDTTLKLDFSEYEEVGTITRWVTTIGYVLFLLLITKQMITW